MMSLRFNQTCGLACMLMWLAENVLCFLLAAVLTLPSCSSSQIAQLPHVCTRVYVFSGGPCLFGSVRHYVLDVGHRSTSMGSPVSSEGWVLVISYRMTRTGGNALLLECGDAVTRQLNSCSRSAAVRDRHASLKPCHINGCALCNKQILGKMYKILHKE